MSSTLFHGLVIVKRFLYNKDMQYTADNIGKPHNWSLQIITQLNTCNYYMTNH